MKNASYGSLAVCTCDADGSSDGQNEKGPIRAAVVVTFFRSRFMGWGSPILIIVPLFFNANKKSLSLW